MESYDKIDSMNANIRLIKSKVESLTKSTLSNHISFSSQMIKQSQEYKQLKTKYE